MSKPNVVGLSELRDARQKRMGVRRSAASADTATSANRRAINEFVESNLSKVDFDVAGLTALIRSSNTQARSRIAEFTSQFDGPPSAALGALSHTVEDVRHRHRRVAAAPTETFLLDTATEISASSGITFDATHLGPAPENNWAKFSYDQTAGGDGWITLGADRMSFGFLWQNPRDDFAVVNVTGFLGLNGVCTVLSEGGFLVHNVARLRVFAELVIHELWNDPPTSPVEQPGQSWQVLSLSCESFGFAEPGDIDGESVARGLAVGFSELVMPAKGTAMFEVACEFDWDIRNGETQSDFSSRDRQVSCPGVLINML